MKILILGASQVGVSIAEVLVGEENDVTIVDVNNDVLQQLQNRLDIRTVTGSAAQPSVLRAAGAEDASAKLPKPFFLRQLKLHAYAPKSI